MKKFTRVLAVLLVLSAVFTFASCGEAENVSAVVTTASADVVETAAETTTGTLDSIPENTDLDGLTVRVRLDDFDQTQYNCAKFYMGPEELTGDVLYDSIFNRNRKVEERLNVSFEYTTVSEAYNECVTPIRTLVLAGDDSFDLLINQQYGLVQLAAEGLLRNFNDLDVNEFDRVYWWDDYMDQLQVLSSDRYIVTGDYFLDTIELATAVFFNKPLYEATYGDSGELYQLAFDGGWTIDAWGKYAREYYQDLDGDGTKNDADVYASNFMRNTMDALCFGCGIDYMIRDEDGVAQLNLQDQRIYTMLEKLVTNFYEPDNCYNYFTTSDSSLGEAEKTMIQRTGFIGNHTLFMNDYIAAVKDLRSMEADYGILPSPKLDETIDEYRSVVHDTPLVGSVPVTSNTFEEVAIVLEVLCSESHDTSVSAYFDQAMKVKYARDENSSRMIDILHDSVTTSFAYAQSINLNTFVSVFRLLYDNRSADYASEFAKVEKGLNSGYEKLVATYLELTAK